MTLRIVYIYGERKVEESARVPVIYLGIAVNFDGLRTGIVGDTTAP